MRFINALLAMAAIALAVASVASAAPTVTLLWMGTTGTGTAGGSSIASKAGDTLTLDILITTDSTGVGFSGASYEISTSGTVTAGTIWPGADSIINWFGTVAYTDITGTATYAARGLTFVSGVTCPYPATGNAVDGCALGTLPVNATGADQANGIVGSFAAGPGGFQDKFTYTQARAQFEVVSIGMDCWLTIEVNALRGGAGHANSGGTKEITAKARIVKGTAPLDATVDDTTLTITSLIGDLIVDQKFSTGLTLVVGKGGQGDKLRMDVPVCAPGQTIDYVAHFSGTASTNGAICEVTSGKLSKTCK
jgi:hypothetical protein